MKSPVTIEKIDVNAGSIWFPYTNYPHKLTFQGIGLGLVYNITKNFSINGNNNWVDFSGETSSDFQDNFNTPKNKFKIGVKNQKVVESLGFNVKFRFQETFLWDSSYEIENINSYGVLDA